MSDVGLHLRITDSLMEVAQRAQEMNLPFFQCFLVLQTTGRLIELSAQEIDAFNQFREKHFKTLYVHGSYWINLANERRAGYRAFERERNLAQQLGFSHMIIHPGSARGMGSRKAGVDLLARVLNRATRKQDTPQIIIENTTHGKMNVGGDLQDFLWLRAKLDRPETIQFCIDTTHAFAYGYDIVSEKGREQFIDLIDETVGIDNVVLLHLNDSRHPRGSRLDQHELPGSGVIGREALRQFAVHPRLQHIPLLLEPPMVEDEVIQVALDDVRTWRK